MWARFILFFRGNEMKESFFFSYLPCLGYSGACRETGGGALRDFGRCDLHQGSELLPKYIGSDTT